MQSVRAALSALLAVMPIVPCFCQVSGPTKGSPIPETVLFRMFFREVMFFEGTAERAAAVGRDAQGPRNEIARRLGLKPQEASLLKEIASSCEARERRHRDDTAAQARALLAQSQRGPAEKVEAERQRSDLIAAGNRITDDCVNRLRTGLGVARFSRLVTLVRASVGPRIKLIPGPEAAR